MAGIEFPIHWDTTTLEAFMPGLTDYVGYDIPLSARFKNVGAPRFIFNKENMNVHFSMEVEVWDKDYHELYMTIKYHDLVIDFDMWLEHPVGQNEIELYWNKIEMDHAEIDSKFLSDKQKKSY